LRSWRALPVGMLGLYLRLRLDETPRFRAVQRADTVAEWPVREALRAYPRQMLVGLALVAAASLTFNTSFIYLPTIWWPTAEFHSHVRWRGRC